MEYIYVLNENGSIKELQDRKEVHSCGILHSAVQCWVMNEQGKVLIQPGDIRINTVSGNSRSILDNGNLGSCQRIK